MTVVSASDRKQYKETLNRMGWSMLLFIGLFFLTTTLSELFQIYCVDRLADSPAHDMLIVCGGVLSAVAYMVPFFLAGMFYYFLSRHTRTERIDLEMRFPHEFPLLILAGLAIITAGGILNNAFCEMIGYTWSETLLPTESYNQPAVVIKYMTIALAPAFAEEFLFRGVFYSNLRPYGRTQAILISSALFALMHENIGQLFYTFVAGIAMALMYELTGSIWCSVFYHLINNELSVISEVIYYGGLGEAASPYLSLFDAIKMALGLISIILLVRFYKYRAATQDENRSEGIYRHTSIATARYDHVLDFKAVIKGMLTPGIIVFSVVTAVLMGITWIAIIAIQSGGV